MAKHKSEQNPSLKSKQSGKSNDNGLIGADGSEGQSEIDAAELIKADHRKVEELFQKFESADGEDKAEIVQKICRELTVHAMIEEEILYPACREQGVEDEDLDEAQVEHDTVKVLIMELMSGDVDDEFFDAKVKVLSEYIKHHVGEEEDESNGILAKAQQGGVDMKAVGKQLQTRKEELMRKAKSNRLEPPSFRSLHETSSTIQEYHMSNYDRYRDEYGRYGGNRGGQGRQYGRGNEHERDEYGRFVSDDDNGYRNRQGDYGRGQYGQSDDDYRRGSQDYGRGYGQGYGQGYGHGGWYGDSEGHSQAAREGWRNREQQYGGGSRGGQYRQDYDDDRRGGGYQHGGWYGDSEGHSQAAREGWRNRQQQYGGGGSRGGQYRQGDDDRGGQGYDHGGWYGDPEGHSEAAREGWRHRREQSGGRRGGY